MAFECPVCDVVAPDGEHLAHHLAVVASARGGEHETWLEAHAPEWSDCEPDELAAVALEHAEEIDHDLVDDVDHDHDPLDPAVAPEGASASRSADASPSDDEAEAVLAEARELTRRMLADERDGPDGSDRSDGADGADSGTEPESDE